MDTLKYKFSDLVDIAALKGLLDNLYESAHIPSAIIDLEGNVLTGAGWQRICLDFYRKNPEAEKLCIQSDIHIRDEIEAGKPSAIYACPHGLVDSCCPILIEGHHVANVFTGQLLHAPLSEEGIERFRQAARQYGFNEKEFLAALSEVPIFPLEQHKSILNFLSQLASQIGQMGLSNLRVLEQKKAVEESEALYRSFFQANHSIMLIIDPATADIVDANPEACAFYGYSKAELISMKISDINILSYDQIQQEMASARDEKRHHFYFQHRLATGEIKDVEVYSGPITRDGEKLLYSIIHDISDRRQAKVAENILAASEERFRELFNNMSSGVAIYQAVAGGNDFIIKDLNKAALLSSQLEYGDAVGKSVLERFPGIKELGLFSVLQRVWQTGIPEELSCSAYQDERISIWVQNYVCKLPSGEVVAIYDDVTEQKKAEEDLVSAKEAWESTFSAMSDIVTIQDREMNIVRANKAAYDFFEIEEGALIGRHCYEVFRGVSEICQGCPLVETLQDVANHSEIIKHDNLGKIFQVSSAATFDQEGNPKFLVHIARDITEQKRLEEELFQAQKMEAIGTLAGGIAHDFNNILSAIIGYTELAKVEMAEGSSAAHDLAEVLQASQRATGLVKQILTFSRKGAHQREALEPYLIVKEALKLMRASLPTTIEIQESIDPESGAILADPTKIHQIIVNLCTNALHAMDEETGTLKVAMGRRILDAGDVAGHPGVAAGEFVELTVTDSGCGMDVQTRQRIFEPYFTTKSIGKGTGLGLAVVLGIVQDYAGLIKVDSEPGCGTTFRVYFPAIKAEANQPGKDEQEGAMPFGTERILSVDDEDTIIALHKAVLSSRGYTVTVMSSSEEALAAFKADPYGFDLLITDQTMPGLSGAKLAKEVLGIRPDMLIILCTGHSATLSEERAMAIGIKKYIMKPVDIKNLTRVVRNVLDGN